MKREVWLSLLLFLVMDSVWAIRTGVPEESACLGLGDTYRPIVESFVRRLTPFLNENNIAVRLRGMILDEGGSDKNKQLCQSMLLKRLMCSVTSSFSDECKRGFFSTSDLAALVHTTLTTEEKPGCAVARIREVSGSDMSLSSILRETLKVAPASRGAVKILRDILVQDSEVLRSLAAKKIDDRLIKRVEEILGKESSELLERKRSLNAEEGLTSTALAQMLLQYAKTIKNVEQRKNLENAISILLGMGIDGFTDFLEQRLQQAGFSNLQKSIVLKVVTRDGLSMTDLATLLGVETERMTSIWEEIDRNKDSKAEIDELKEFVRTHVIKLPSVAPQDISEGIEQLNELFKPEVASDGDFVPVLKKKLDGIEKFASGQIENLRKVVLEELNAMGAKRVETAIDSKLRVKSHFARFISVLESDKTNKVAYWIKLVIWGLIYLFCLISMIYVTNFMTFKPEAFSFLIGTVKNAVAPELHLLSDSLTLAHEQGLLQTNMNANHTDTIANSMTTLIQSFQSGGGSSTGSDTTQTETETITSPSTIDDTPKLPPKDKTAGDITRTWRISMWIISFVILAGYLIQQLEWKVFGKRLFSLGSLHESSHRWYMRDDIWALVPIIFLFIPMCLYTLRYFRNGDTATIINVYLELISLVSAYQVGIDILQRQIDPKTAEVVKGFIELHKSPDYEGECEGEPLEKTLSDIMKLFLDERDDLKCDFFPHFSAFMETKENQKVAMDLVQHLTVTALCQDQLKHSQRSLMLRELQMFEMVLVRLVLAFQNKG